MANAQHRTKVKTKDGVQPTGLWAELPWHWEVRGKVRMGWGQLGIELSAGNTEVVDQEGPAGLMKLFNR